LTSEKEAQFLILVATALLFHVIYIEATALIQNSHDVLLSIGAVISLNLTTAVKDQVLLTGYEVAQNHATDHVVKSRL